VNGTAAVISGDIGRDDDVLDHDEHLAIVALGSSLGNRQAYLRLAVTSFPKVKAASQVFETDPVGGPEGQGRYLNMVLAVLTTLDPYAFLRHCQRIEALACRQRVVHWGPRTLDVDVLFYDDVHIDDPHLTIPHPRCTERRFVLAPLAEIAPERCPANWNEALPPEGVYPRGPLLL
jgi:2-amino-4-hydroxy-6-hydroxymethyldihydropteridine diphosphokinase